MTHAVRSSMQVDLAEQPARRSEMLLQSPDFSDLPQLHVNGEVNLRPCRLPVFLSPLPRAAVVLALCCLHLLMATDQGRLCLVLQFLGSTHTIQELEDYSELDAALAVTDPNE